MAWAVIIKNPVSVPDKDTGAVFSGVTPWLNSRSEAEAVFMVACEDYPDFEVTLVQRDMSRAPIKD